LPGGHRDGRHDDAVLHALPLRPRYSQAHLRPTDRRRGAFPGEIISFDHETFKTVAFEMVTEEKISLLLHTQRWTRDRIAGMSIAVLKVALMEKGRCSAVSALNFFLVEPPLSRGILHEWHAPLNQLAILQRRSGLVRRNCAQLPR
jgi:hypothetical protein